MLTSFLTAIIAVFLRFIVSLLAGRWEEFNNLILPLDIAMWVTIAIFAVFTALYAFRYIKDVFK